jgi:predicted Zn finger-like uncharacterized protein
MILTCPECATSYFVDESKIPPEGRTVKCAACGARWTAHAEASEPAPGPDLDDIYAEPVQRPAAASEALAPLDGDLTGEDLPKAFRAKADTTRRVREAAATGIVWAGMAATVALVIALSIVFRANVVRMWPKSAAAYAAIGLPVNSLGLAIENVKAKPTLKNGHAALSISGVIRNIEGRAIITPPLKISLLDKDGQALSTKIARAADPRIPPGETRHFALIMLDPPAAAHDLEIAFAPDAKGGAAAPEPTRAAHAPVELRGAASAPEPEEVRPLPEGSPDALAVAGEGSDGAPAAAHAPAAHAPAAHD